MDKTLRHLIVEKQEPLMLLEQVLKEPILATVAVITVVLAVEQVDYHIMVMALLEQLALVAMVEVILTQGEVQEPLVKLYTDL